MSMEADPDWFRTFFDDVYVDAATARLTPERTERECDQVARALGVRPGERVLDLACGHGRHAIEMAARRYRVVGLDLSAPSLARARAAMGADARPDLVRGDSRTLPFADASFDAVVHLHTAFGYFDDEDDDARVLAEVARVLRRGGGLVLDQMSPLWLFRHFTARGFLDAPDGGVVLEERRYDPLSGRSVARWTFIAPDGRREERVHSVRLYTLAEMRRLLAAAGLEIALALGGADDEPYDLDAPRLVIVARRKL